MHLAHSDALLSALIWLMIVSVLIARAIDQSRLFAQLQPVAETAGRLPRIAVVVPVRNESDNVAACLHSLVAQDYPRDSLDLFVVNDHSTDDTAEIVRRLAAESEQIHFVDSPELPRGWVGKSHACAIGADRPDAVDWLCFIDADVRGAPALLASAVTAASRDGTDLLSLSPRHELVSFAERLILPCGHYLLAFCQDLRRRQGRDGADATATGQFMLIRTAAYRAVGGHAAVRGAICEDVELARRLKRAGYRVELRSGAALLWTRMYTGWHDLWPGLIKNLVDMLGGPWRTAAISACALFLAWAALVIPAVALWHCSAHGSCIAFCIAAVATLAAFGFHVAGARHFGIPFWYGLIFPVGYTIGAAMALDSIRVRWQGRVPWKGRTYP